MNPYAILGGLVALAVAFGIGMATNGYMRDAKENKQLLAAQSAAIQIKDAWNADIARQKQEQADEVARINDRLSDALVRLRNRPDRLPEPARKACEGATGAELAAGDGEFLTRYAAAAAAQQTALMECYAWVDTITAK